MVHPQDIGAHTDDPAALNLDLRRDATGIVRAVLSGFFAWRGPRGAVQRQPLVLDFQRK